VYLIDKKILIDGNLCIIASMKNLKLKRISSLKLLGHVLFWIVVWFFFVYFFSYNSSDREYITWFSSMVLPLTMMVTYFMVYFLIPRYLLVKKYRLFILYSFYTFVFTAYIVVLVVFGSFVYITGYQISNMPPMSKNIVFVLIIIYLIVGIVGFVSLLNHNFQTISRNKELQNKILETQLQLKEQELHYLKMQIHPHFLFNTLNTIYGFALKQSKQTPEIILMLSNLLDYILYQVNKPKVSLKDEVMHIKEYIELEKIRFQDTLKVVFSAGDINGQIEIAPMLLIPFVENAFKHGNLVDGYLKIELNVAVTDSQLDFRIRNTVMNQEDKNEQGGIGLENIRKRLDLHYSNNYRLTIENNNNWYSVHLVVFDLT
jgi:two-component system LytT family sensor kinase